jgi:hypothetical protein
LGAWADSSGGPVTALGGLSVGVWGPGLSETGPWAGISTLMSPTTGALQVGQLWSDSAHWEQAHRWAQSRRTCRKRRL